MSMGYGGRSTLVQADDDLVMYSYSCYNQSDDDRERFEKMEDGELYIDRDCFIGPEIHEKIKKMPSGRKKLVVKRIIRDVPYGKYLEDGRIEVKNASGTWHTTIKYGIDMMALTILHYLFRMYQETDEIPPRIGLYW